MFIGLILRFEFLWFRHVLVGFGEYGYIVLIKLGDLCYLCCV